jgi:hypothetical protein
MAMYKDVYKVSYKKLMQKVKDNSQYKGPQGQAKLLQYPVGDRKKSHRFFVLDGDVFRIYMLWRQDYLANNDNAKTQLHEVARVHPDNSYEFINCTWMSHQQFSGELCGFMVKQSVRHGGPVMYMYGNIKHPIYKGLRISLDSGEAVTPYTVKYRKLKRKESEEVLAQPHITEFKNMWPVMLEALTPSGIRAVLLDIVPRDGEDNPTTVETRIEDVLVHLDKRNYADAALMFALHTGVASGWSLTKERMANMHPDTVYGNYFMNRLRAEVYKTFDSKYLRTQPHVFKYVDRKEGEPLIGCKWGYVVESVQTDLFGGHKIVR